MATFFLSYSPVSVTFLTTVVGWTPSTYSEKSKVLTCLLTYFAYYQWHVELHPPLIGFSLSSLFQLLKNRPSLLNPANPCQSIVFIVYLLFNGLQEQLQEITIAWVSYGTCHNSIQLFHCFNFDSLFCCIIKRNAFLRQSSSHISLLVFLNLPLVWFPSHCSVFVYFPFCKCLFGPNSSIHS